MKLYAAITRVNGFIFPGTPWNPKLVYSTLKAVWRRAKRDVLGVEYRPDATSVNIAITKPRVLICAIPKVGGTTLARELVDHRLLGDPVQRYSCFLGDLLQRHPEFHTYHKVAFVRNPWARVVSVYNSKICAPKPAFVRTFFIRYPGIRHGMSFGEFVEWLCTSEEGGDAVADRHWISQHRFVRLGGTMLVDRLARIEVLDQEFRLICDRAGVPPRELGNYSLRTTSGGSSYRQYYDEHTAELVAQRYSADIRLLGYNF